MKRKLILGMSLLEILVVVALFAVLGVMATRAILLTLRGTNRSDSSLRVRENLNYALSVVERQLRNAQDVAVCPNPDPLVLNYTDHSGYSESFSCINVGSSGYIASGSARLTSTEVAITSCSIVCARDETSLPPTITVTLEAEDAQASGLTKARSSSTAKILLRSY